MTKRTKCKQCGGMMFDAPTKCANHVYIGGVAVPLVRVNGRVFVICAGQLLEMQA